MRGLSEGYRTGGVGPSNDAPVFNGPEGGRPRRLTLNHAFQATRQTIGRPELPFHDSNTPASDGRWLRGRLPLRSCAG